MSDQRNLTWVDGDAVTAPEEAAVGDDLELYVDDDPSSSFRTVRNSPTARSATSATLGAR